MGTLASYTPEYDSFSVKGQAVRVRGLNLDDISLLVRAHLDTVETIVGVVKSAHAGSPSGDFAARLVLELAQGAPRLAAQIIALAADEPDQAETVAKMPFPVVVDALTKVARLTFEEAGGIQGFVNALAGLATGLRKPASAATG